MLVETFQSEISIDDLDDQINTFIEDGNFKIVETKRTAYCNGGFIDYTAQVMYAPILESMMDIIEQILQNIKHLN
jgi:hypothetical protein